MPASVDNQTPPAKLEVSRRGGVARIDVLGDIGPSRMQMIDAAQVAAALDELNDDDELLVRIDSRGGVGHVGLAIYSLLRQHPGKKTVRVLGIAGSAASLVAMAGDVVEMPANTTMMIHEPSVGVFGGERALQRALRELANLKAAAVETYAAKTGLPADRIGSLMADETWMSAAEAVELGFADRVVDDVPIASHSTLFAPENVPEGLSQFFDRTDPAFLQDATMTKPKDVKDPKPQDAQPPADPAPELKDGETPPADPKPADPAPKPAPKPDAKPEPPPAPQLSAEEVVKREVAAALSADRKRQSEIRALCRTARMEHLADKFCSSDEPLFSVEDVRAELFDRLVKKNAAPSDVGGDDPVEDADAKFKAEFAADRKGYLAAGISEADYVASRRIDEGLDVLTVGSASS